MQTALTQAFVGHARLVTSFGQECNIVTQSCPLHLAIETPWGPVRLTMPFIVLPVGHDVVIIGQKTLREKLGIDVMAQLKASVLKAHGREDGPEMDHSQCCGRAQRRCCAAGGDGCHGVRTGRRRR